MAIKRALFKIKGMHKDLSESAFNPEFAYENKNLRILATTDNTQLSLTNELGTECSYISGIGDYLKGKPVGKALLNDELVLFTTDNNNDDYIYKLWFDEDRLKGKVLYDKGNLGFNTHNPIEALTFYENDEIKKVYWTDGKNQPRVINIAAAQKEIDKWNKNSFDFVPTLKLQESINIKRNLVASGIFAPGVIQYAFTYFNKYGRESNIFYTSPLYYISYNNRGASPEDKVGNSFDIDINNADGDFDYIRVYSIHRTSINSTPECKIVADLSPKGTIVGRTLIDATKESWVSYGTILDSIKVIENVNTEYDYIHYPSKSSTDPDTGDSITIYTLPEGNDYFIYGENASPDIYVHNLNKEQIVIEKRGRRDGSIEFGIEGNVEMSMSYNTEYDYSVHYTDNGTTGSTIDPTELLYIGGEEVVFGTMAQKDNTLFLGDIKLKRKYISQSIIKSLREEHIYFYPDKDYKLPKPKSYYQYNNNLKLNSEQVKTFKYLEWYRFGIQLQYYTGKWSEPIWIEDVKNDKHITGNFWGGSYYDDSFIKLVTASYTTSNKKLLKDLLDLGFIRIRPVVVYPNLSDRECVCQGILCPTVYNVGDRYSNSPFVQSSWFTRPNAPFDFDRTFDYDGKESVDMHSLGGPEKFKEVSRGGILSGGIFDVTEQKGPESTVKHSFDVSQYGDWSEFRHNCPIPDSDKRNAEIQCMYNTPKNPLKAFTSTDIQIEDWININQQNFYIDQSILTFHSPDIEFNNDVRSIDSSNLKLRIVGMVPMTSFYGDIDVRTSTPPTQFKDSPDVPRGFYKEKIAVECSFNNGKTGSNLKLGTQANFGWRGLNAAPLWFDETYKASYKNPEDNRFITGFVVYPWHRNGSLGNQKHPTENGIINSKLDTKRLSNLRVSYNSAYYDTKDIWNAEVEGDDVKTGISGVSIFDSNEVTLTKINAPLNSGLQDLNYYGNIDKLITGNYSGDNGGYPIMMGGRLVESNENIHKIFGATKYTQVTETSDTVSTNPIRMKYKSTPHAVIALNYTKDRKQRILPTITDSSTYYTGENPWIVNNCRKEYITQKPFWEIKAVQSSTGVSQDVINSLKGDCDINSIQYGWLWLGELYNDNVTNRFGGNTEEAFENNLWLPCGEPVSILDKDNNIKDYVEVKWTEGDTYYQRYDHIKTYPFTLEDQNEVTDIVSFMCETRVNLDGRYDRNRGQTSNFTITPKNFNKLNEIYSQENNFFNYRTINHNKLNLDNFHNAITWTKTKVAGELTDTWTNITLASILDLDGDKGSIRALRRFNNNIIAFQDKGISHILYNENTQISTTEGVPIEIANSGKVQGKRYITDKIGCTNKWSICETSNGIYFIDDITKAIYLFNGKVNNISDKFGMHSWINTKSDNLNIWNPEDFNNTMVTYSDSINNDVFFISKDECLGFSEPLGAFSSFYSYNDVPYFSNLQDRGLWFKPEENNTKVWLHNEGKYNMFFGKYEPFYTTLIVNPNPTEDKIFNNIEFRSDSWNNGTLVKDTFDKLYAYNEYQSGESSLDNLKNKPSNLKEKFRVWRANIPRDNMNPNIKFRRDRIRNPWTYIKLSKEKENTNKTILHDIVVDYFE